MKGFLRSKLVLTLAALLMIAAAIVIPLSGSIIHSHAQAPTGTITLSPATGAPSTSVTATGSGFLAGDSVSVLWVPTHTFLTTVPSFILVMSDGTFTASFTIPADAVPGTTATIEFRIEDNHPPIIVDKSFAVTLPIPTPVPTPTPPPGPDILVNTDVNCSTSTTPVALFDKGATAKGSATLNSTDSTEYTQNEPLILKDTAGKLTPVTVSLPTNKTTNTVSFSLAVPAGDMLVACITGGDNDELATITVKNPSADLKQLLSGFVSLVGEAAGCALDFLQIKSGTIPALKKALTLYRTGQIKNIAALLDLNKALIDIAQGKANAAALLIFGVRLIPFEGCVEAIVDILVPGQKAALEECLTGTTQVDMTCRMFLAQRIQELLPPFIVF